MSQRGGPSFFLPTSTAHPGDSAYCRCVGPSARGTADHLFENFQRFGPQQFGADRLVGPVVAKELELEQILNYGRVNSKPSLGRGGLRRISTRFKDF